MASSIDNAFITQYGRRKNMGTKVVPRIRKPIPVPSHEELMEGRKKLKPYRPKPKPKPKKKKEKKKEKKKSPVQTLLYKGRPIGSRKRSVSV